MVDRSSLETFVLIHGVAVAIFQGNNLWPMFAFGFGAMIVLTQIHGLGLGVRTRRILTVRFRHRCAGHLWLHGAPAGLDEVVRIPVLEYGVVALIYGLYLAIDRFATFLKPKTAMQAAD